MAFLLSALFIAAFSHGASTQQVVPADPYADFKAISITEKTGNSLTLEDLFFQNEQGQRVSLASYFQKGSPVILSLVYYECPNLCTFVLNGLVESLKSLNEFPGQKFEIISVSIKPNETPQLASRKKEAYLKDYGREGAESGWHFLVGEESQIKKLAHQVGFGYRYNSQEKQYDHSAAIFILTPLGKISRYFYGIQYPPKDLRLALLEASSEKTRTVIDRILLYCYRYDPVTKKYSIYLTRLMQIGSAGMVLIFGGYMILFWSRQRKGRK